MKDAIDFTRNNDMPIPTYDKLLLPLLNLLADGNEHSIREATDHFDEHLNLNDEERERRLPSGPRIVAHRVGWARTYLKKAELLDYPRRGFMKITANGARLLRSSPKTLTLADLRRIPNFIENWTNGTSPKPSTTPNDLTPEEVIDAAIQELDRNLSSEILEQISRCSPGFFERLVIELLLKMGYGGSFEDAGRAIGKSGDGGIDGIIKEDKLGLDLIYIQAKRWQGTVGRPEIQKFMGALAGHRAKKGVFITNSKFSAEAEEYAVALDVKLVLIDGAKLTELMIEHDVGVASRPTRAIKRLDSEYFAED